MRSDSVIVPKKSRNLKSWAPRPLTPHIHVGNDTKSHANQRAMNHHVWLRVVSTKRSYIINLIVCYGQMHRQGFAQNHMKKKAFKLYHWLINNLNLVFLSPSPPPLKKRVGTWESLLTRQYQKKKKKKKGTRLVNTHCEFQHILYPSAFFKTSAAEFYARCWKVLKEKFSCPTCSKEVRGMIHKSKGKVECDKF